MSQGILIPKNRIDENSSIYDTRRDRLQIALNHTPPHHDILTSIGSAIVTNAGNNFVAKEILFRIKHNLPYKPKALVYFYIPSNGSYNVGKFFYGGGAIDDYLGYEVDANEFRIFHEVDDFFNSGYTSTAPSFGNFRFKYSIFSNPVNNYTDPAKR